MSHHVHKFTMTGYAAACECGFILSLEQLTALATEYYQAGLELWEIQHSPENTGDHCIGIIAEILERGEPFGLAEPDEKVSRRNYRARQGELAKRPEGPPRLYRTGP
jgi:hypothetical protein